MKLRGKPGLSAELQVGQDCKESGTLPGLHLCPSPPLLPTSDLLKIRLLYPSAMTESLFFQPTQRSTCPLFSQLVFLPLRLLSQSPTCVANLALRIKKRSSSMLLRLVYPPYFLLLMSYTTYISHLFCANRILSITTLWGEKCS